MSSSATFYILPDAKRAEFAAAHRNQKTVTYRSGFFGQKQIVTGELFLWEYLDAATADRDNFPFSGSAYIDYFCLFVADTLPADLTAALNDASVDEHHDVFSSDLAARLLRHLQAHPPDSAALAAFAAEQNPKGGADYMQCLRETHQFLWDGSVASCPVASECCTSRSESNFLSISSALPDHARRWQSQR